MRSEKKNELMFDKQNSLNRWLKTVIRWNSFRQQDGFKEHFFIFCSPLLSSFRNDYIVIVNLHDEKRARVNARAHVPTLRRWAYFRRIFAIGFSTLRFIICAKRRDSQAHTEKFNCLILHCQPQHFLNLLSYLLPPFFHLIAITQRCARRGGEVKLERENETDSERDPFDSCLFDSNNRIA